MSLPGSPGPDQLQSIRRIFLKLIFLLAAADKILGRRLFKMIFWRELMNCNN
jgi:hypothetical protein